MIGKYDVTKLFVLIVVQAYMRLNNLVKEYPPILMIILVIA